MYLLKNLFAFLGFLLILGIIGLIGEAVIGSENKGGARLVVFSIGGFFIYISILFVRDIPSVFSIVFSMFLGAFALYCMVMSVFASRETVEKIINDFVGGI